MEISDDKYSMNDGTGLELTTLSSTVQTGWESRGSCTETHEEQMEGHSSR